MDQFSTYILIIGATSAILLAFVFSSIANRTNVPAVLMLLGLGVGLQFLLKYWGREDLDFSSFLEILGVVGLFVIVLEAALNLKLSKGKAGIIVKSFIVALLGLGAAIGLTATILHYMIEGMTWPQALLYATPLSIMSSAIVIPGVRNFNETKKDFQTYESTFSDILGIMAFFFLVWLFDPIIQQGLSEEGLVGKFFTNSAETVAIALVTSYVVLFIFQRIQVKAELFVLMSVLLLIYAVSKELQLSTLVVIMVFGIVMSNLKLFFIGPLRRMLKPETFREMEEGLHALTIETSFIVRIFVFIIFGASIVLMSLLNLKFLVISGVILVSIYITRWILLRIFIGKNLSPQLWMAPRGLITILLFYAIPTVHQTTAFNSGILLLVIILSGLVMTAGRIGYRMRRADEKAAQLKTEDEGIPDAIPLPETSYVPTGRTDGPKLEKGLVWLHVLKRKIKHKIISHPLYIVEKKRFKRLVDVSLQTLGIQLIFNPETKKFNERLRNVISILRNPAKRVNLKQSQDYQTIKKYIHRIIFETDTLEGLLFDIGLFVLIMLSVFIVMLESISSIQPAWGPTLKTIDWIITILFTIEYALRIWTTRQPRKYIFSFFGMVDLLSILPLYAEIIFSGLYSLEIIRVVRLVRIFRVLKLIRFMSEADLILRSLRSSANKIFVFLFFVLIVCTILGSVMFLVEGPESGFVNIPQGIYWAVVTLTTVGYGDIYPVTGMGQFIAMVLMVMGYGVIAVPTGLVAAGVMVEARKQAHDKAEEKEKSIAHCPNCHNPVPEHALYCPGCGMNLTGTPVG